MTYAQYHGRFKDVMRQIGATHTPHEARHTFISCAKHFKIDDNIIKALVGHKIRDVTEAVYTHRSLSDYAEAIAMINYDGEDIEPEMVDTE